MCKKIKKFDSLAGLMNGKYYLTLIFIYIFLITSMVNICCVYWLLGLLLWIASLYLLPFICFVVFFSLICKVPCIVVSFACYIGCKYLLLACNLSFHPANVFFCRTKVLNFKSSEDLISSLMEFTFSVKSMKSSPSPRSWRLSPFFLKGF